MGIGIDISPASSVLVQLTKSGLTYKLGRTSIMPGFRHESDVPAARAANTDFGRSLKSLPSSLKRGDPVVSLPGREVMYRITGMGADNDGAIRTLVRMEVEDLAGSADMLSSYQRVYTPDGMAQLLIGVSRVSLVEHYQASMAACDLRPQGFVPAPAALYQCHLMSGDLDYSGIQLIANVGEETTDVILVQGSDLLAGRTLTFGVSTFVNEISQVIGVNSEQARETLFSRINMRPGVGGENISGERSVAAAQDIASKLYAQLNSAINFAKVQVSTPNLNVGKISICGSGAAIQGLREFLMSRFRKTVEVLNPLAGVDTSNVNDPAIRQYQTALALPLGLAKIACDGFERSLNFQAPSAIARQAFVQRTAWLYAGVILLVAALAYSLIISSGMVEEVQDLKQEATRRSRSYQAANSQLRDNELPPNAPVDQQVGAMAEINKTVMLSEQKAIELAALQRPGISTLGITMELGRLAPEELRITGVDLVHTGGEGQPRRPRVVISFYAQRKDMDEQAAYERFITTLRADPRLVESTIKPEELQNHPSGRGKTGVIRFALSDASQAFGTSALDES